MRLTLRTLLAYLDDVLEPAEIKEIGQKVAESETARELMVRIKQSVRSRRLTTPPADGPDSPFDSNIVAEYLDNTLPPEQIADIEKVCLESDVHLAEVAACHQILTLLLERPALVPPVAKSACTHLIRGREAIPSRRPGPEWTDRKDDETASAANDADDSSLFGLSAYRRQGPLLRWLLPLAGILLVGPSWPAIWITLTAPGRHRHSAHCLGPTLPGSVPAR